MLTTTATIIFLLVASSLAALAVHEWLGGRSGSSSDSTADAFATIDDLDQEVRGELDEIQRKLLEGRAALAEESRRLDAAMVQAAAGDSVRPAVSELEAAVASMQARSEELAQEIERRGQSCIKAGAQHESAIAATLKDASSGQAELRSDLEQLSRAVADLSAQVVDVERAAIESARIESIEATVAELQSSAGQASAESGVDVERMVALEGTVEELIMGQGEQQPAASVERVVALEASVEELMTVQSEQKPSVDVDRVKALEASVAELTSGADDSRLVELEALVMELMAKVEDQPSISVFESRIEGLEVQCADLAAARISEDRIAKIEQSFFSQDLRLCTLEDDVQDMATASVAASAAPVMPPTASERDDLKKIKGIGTVIEQTLNSCGIQSFEQVANLTMDDIERLSDQLGAFAGRVERDQWIAQARSLVS